MQVVVGRVGKAHGLRGEVSVEVRTDEPEIRFAAGSVLVADPGSAGPLTVAGARWHRGRLLLSFAEVADRSAADGLRGVLLLAEISEDERPEDPDEFYDHQLAGLPVVTTTGGQVGVIAEVLHLPSQDLLAVRTAEGREVLIPFVAQLVPTVDLAARRVVVDPPAGLIDGSGEGLAEE
jgi:16S rRNA processing protein RimM